VILAGVGVEFVLSTREKVLAAADFAGGVWSPPVSRLVSI
jgi:hypothetical protein